jgi:flavin reductase (DIM6/NTAB) family NADH-FMN oxidoreductase RutF
MIIDPAALDRRELNGLVNGLVSPRPIAWISSLAADGSRNLAPFSFFNAFSFDPPTIGVGPGSRGGVNKDSLRNIRETGEFVVNLVSEQLAGLANVCSAEFGADVDEWEVSGVRPATCELVAPARVAEAPASLECRVLQIVDLGEPGRPTNSLVIARVLRIHVIDEALDGLIPKPEVLQLVGRMGGDLWCRTQDTFELPRPGTVDAEALGRHAAALAEGRGA